MCLWCCWKDLDEQDLNEIYLVRFGFRNMGDIDFEVISATENSNKFQKNQVLEGKINRGRGNTWANGTSHTSSNHEKQTKYKKGEISQTYTIDNQQNVYLNKH